jgi:hypothetical protein
MKHRQYFSRISVASLALVFGLISVLSACGGDNGGANGVTTAVSAAQANRVKSKFTAPSLTNPVDPRTYGAKCDGVTDDSAAFQAAVNVSDVLVPNKTCVINSPVNITVSNRHIQCETGTPTGTLQQTNPYGGHIFAIYSPSGGVLTGDSIVNCTFIGANTVAPQYYGNDNRHWDIPIETFDFVSNFMLAGNTFKQFFGQSMFQTYGTVNGGQGDLIEYNTFQSCGYYGPVFDAHTNGYIGHNILTDCAMGVENDNASQNSGGNVIEDNTVTAIYGYGAPDMGTSAMLTGGVAGNANYSTNIVRYNTISGTSNSQGFEGPGRPTAIWEQTPNGAAQYIGNTCGTGCQVH